MTGLVLADSIALPNVHVKNISSGKFSVSGESGEFQLSLKPGDTLVFSHVAMNDLIAIIQNKDLKEPVPTFRMFEKSSELREVVLDKTAGIDAVSLGIIPKKIEKLSVNERRLRASGDFKPVHLLGIIGGGVSIDAILNAINGRTKKLKRNINIEQKQRHINFLEINYSNYMTGEMELSDQESALLINEVIEDEELISIIQSANEARMKLFLQDRWFRFSERLEKDQFEKE